MDGTNMVVNAILAHEYPFAKCSYKLQQKTGTTFTTIKFCTETAPNSICPVSDCNRITIANYKKTQEHKILITAIDKTAETELMIDISN